MGVTSSGQVDRRHVRGKTRGDVTRKVRQLEEHRERGRLGEPGRPPPVATWLEQWLVRIGRTVKPKTLAGYTTYTRQYAIPQLGRHRLDRLRPEDVEDLYSWMSDRGLSPSTVASMHRILRSALNDAVARGHLTSNPVTKIKSPREPVVEIEPLTIDDTRRILAAAEGRRNSARWAVALSLGLRQGEALALKWGDVNLDTGLLLVRRALYRQTWRHGCEDPQHCAKNARSCPRRAGGGLVTDTPKSNASRRALTLPPPLRQLLRTHRIVQDAERLAAGDMWRDEGWIFATETGAPIDPRRDWGAWKDLLRDAGVRDARLHDARHTAATLLLVQGVDARTVMDLMGWSQTSMTRRYQHVVPELKETAAERIGEALWGSSPRSTTEHVSGPAFAPRTEPAGSHRWRPGRGL
jgi:integrase